MFNKLSKRTGIFRFVNFYSIVSRTIVQNFRFFPALFLILAVSCSSGKQKAHPSEGIIVYNIHYINHSGKNIPIQLLPKTMEMKFNSRFISYSIEDRLGLFTIQNISDINKRNHITLVKVFDKKFVYKGLKNETSILFDTLANYHIKMLDDTLRLAGLLCRKARVSNPATNECFDVFYTPEIELDHPNNNTPYQKIKGMLLGFRIPLKNIDLELTAKKINCKNISDEIFEVPEAYKYISKTEMEKILTSLLP